MTKLSLVQSSDDIEVEANSADILSDIVVPERFYNRMKMGVDALDHAFGGEDFPGIMPGTSILFTGVPGAGKSTVALQIADLLTSKQNKMVLYNATEENKWMIKLRADRLGIAGRFLLSYHTDLEVLLEYVEEIGIEVLFVDSLQQLTYKDYEGRKLLEKVVTTLHKFGHTNNVTTFIIGQVTKKGTFSGPNSIKHDTDAHAHMGIDKDSGMRVFEMTKNRHGPAGLIYEFVMTGKGLEFKQAESVESSSREVKRENIKEFIINKLKEGDRISGYCFERFNQDVSGGYWRGMVAAAAQSLTKDGYTIGEDRNGPGGKGRTHVYILGLEEEGELYDES